MLPVVDDRLQDLRRRVAQGEPGARAALLAERVRTGDLARERLELAAHVGDEDARRIAGPTRSSLDREALSSWPREALVRGLVAAARVAFEAFKREPLDFPRPSWVAPESTFEMIREAIESSERWILDPAGSHLPVLLLVTDAGRSAWWVMLGPTITNEKHEVASTNAAFGIRSAAEQAGEGVVAAAIRNEVAPWALGERDPVRERVEAAGG